MIYKLKLIIFILLLTKIISCQEKEMSISKESISDTENLLSKFNELTQKLPTYENYYPSLFTLDKKGQYGLNMITEVESPKDVELARKSISDILKKDTFFTNVKVIALSFIDEVEEPTSKTKVKVIAIYTEHKNEPVGLIYYFPFQKEGDNIVFNKSINFTKQTKKLIL